MRCCCRCCCCCCCCCTGCRPKNLKELERGWGGGRSASPPDAVAVAAGATLKIQGRDSHSEHRKEKAARKGKPENGNGKHPTRPASVPSFLNLPYFLTSFHSFLPSFLPSFPSFLPSFLPSCLPPFLPSFLPASTLETEMRKKIPKLRRKKNGIPIGQSSATSQAMYSNPEASD